MSHMCHNILTETNQLTYLGTVLSNDVSPHIVARIKVVRGDFYNLQDAGLCKNRVNVNTLRHILNTALHPVLLFGCANLNISKEHLLQLDKQLARLLKLAIGLPKWCKHYNLINFLDTKLISTAVLTSQLSTLKSAIQGTSQVRHIYRFLLSKVHLFIYTLFLISRVKRTCNSNDISSLLYLFDDSYVAFYD